MSAWHRLHQLVSEGLSEGLTPLTIVPEYSRTHAHSRTALHAHIRPIAPHTPPVAFSITFSKTCSVAMVVLGLCIYYNAKKLDIARVRRASDGGGLGPARGLAGGGSSGELLVAQQASSMEANEAKELRKERAEWKREADVL